MNIDIVVTRDHYSDDIEMWDESLGEVKKIGRYYFQSDNCGGWDGDTNRLLRISKQNFKRIFGYTPKKGSKQHVKWYDDRGCRRCR